MDKIAHKVTKKLADYQYKQQGRPHAIIPHPHAREGGREIFHIWWIRLWEGKGLMISVES